MVAKLNLTDFKEDGRMLTEKQKKSADVFTLVEARFSEATSTYAASTRNARFLLEDAQRKSRSRAADATARQHMLEAEVDRNFEDDKLRKYLVSQVVAARNEAEGGKILTSEERTAIVDSIDAAGAALDDLRRVHADLSAAITAAEGQLAAAEYELSGFRNPCPAAPAASVENFAVAVRAVRTYLDRFADQQAKGASLETLRGLIDTSEALWIELTAAQADGAFPEWDADTGKMQLAALNRWYRFLAGLRE